MATTIPVPTARQPKRRPEPMDELDASFFDQMQYAGGGHRVAPEPPQGQRAVTGAGAPGADARSRPTVMHQQPTTQAAPKGNLDFSTLVGAPANTQQPQPRTVNGEQLQMAQTQQPTSSQPAAPPGQRNTAPPLQDQGAPAAAPVRINHNTYQPPGGGTSQDFFAQLQPGSPVQEAPGLVWQHDGQGWVQMPAGAAPPGNPTQQPNPRPAWMTSQPYTPGDIGTDDLRFSYQDLMDQMGPDYTPTKVSGSGYQSQDVGAENFDPYEFGGWAGMTGMDVGPVEGLTEDLVMRMLTNPDSLDAKTIARMKAAGREEQSEFGRMEQEELTGLGYDMGIEDSNFLASERLQSRRDRDAAISSSNRGIEIDAAKTNAGDRRAAAALGSAYVDSKGRLQLAKRAQEFGEQAEGERNKQVSAASKQSRAEYLTGVKSDNANRQLEAAKLRTQADVANNQNMFNAAKLRQDKVLGTVDADLRRAAATTDRLSLREQAAQAAAELGISQDKVMSDWLQSLMDDATQRYGIDIAASVDREKLQQAGGEFAEDLAFRIMALDKEMGFKYAQLGESGRQHDYGLGLGYAQLQQRANESDNDFYARSQGF